MSEDIKESTKGVLRNGIVGIDKRDKNEAQRAENIRQERIFGPGVDDNNTAKGRLYSTYTDAG